MTNNFCPNCGEHVIREDAAICYNCGNKFNEVTATQPYVQNSDSYERKNAGAGQRPNYGNYNNNNNNNYNHAEVPRVQHTVNPKSPFIAFILSFFWVGLGQLYNGKFLKGILYQVGFVVGLFFIIFPGIIVWIICLWDAYNDAEKMNRGEIPVTNPSFGEIMVFIFFWLLVLIAIMAVFMIMMIPLAFI